jgi:hypothetical protein
MQFARVYYSSKARIVCGDLYFSGKRPLLVFYEGRIERG